MNKTKNVIAAFLLLTMISSCFILPVHGQATTYSCGVKVGDLMEWEVSKVNEDKLLEVWKSEASWKEIVKKYVFAHDAGNEMRYLQGAKFKAKVTTIDVGTNGWKVSFDVWDWTSSEFAASTINTTVYWLYNDPVQDVYWSWSDILLATTVGTYLNGLTGLTYKVEGNSVVMDNNTVNGFPIILRWTYDETTGLLNSFTIETLGAIIYGINVLGIPGYDLPVFLGFLILGITSLVFLRKKKK